MSQIITGIQQVGIGVTDVNIAWEWYRTMFGTDVPVFDDVAEAKLMTRYTGNEVHSRRAVLALNMNGGGGFEIWQFKSREPEHCTFDHTPGDLGINAVKIKCRNITEAHSKLLSGNTDSVSQLFTLPNGEQSFQVRDPYNNLFQLVKGDSWFQKHNSTTGGVCGAMIGVSDIETALPLYTDALGFRETIYDETGTFTDLDPEYKFRRILLRKKQRDEGAFSRLFGHIDIELIQVFGRKPQKIYHERFWGDPGFIHICFDVNNMDLLKEKCRELGYHFTVDSASTFDMGEAAGRFSYIEDPDGTLIEFVQAHKLPILKKWGWYINLKKRKHQKPLPDWMLKTMSFNRVK
ncbi:MAG: VOC family protein [Balneolaceae bacterium]|nr:VOC family protein [Balneolaceae bacterium]